MYKLKDWIDIENIDWRILSQNPNAISLLEKNQHKILWSWLSSNPSIFEIDYESLKERCAIYKEELMQIALHPLRIQKLLDAGISIGELDNYI